MHKSGDAVKYMQRMGTPNVLANAIHRALVSRSALVLSAFRGAMSFSHKNSVENQTLTDRNRLLIGETIRRNLQALVSLLGQLLVSLTVDLQTPLEALENSQS